MGTGIRGRKESGSATSRLIRCSSTPLHNLVGISLQKNWLHQCLLVRLLQSDHCDWRGLRALVRHHLPQSSIKTFQDLQTLPIIDAFLLSRDRPYVLHPNHFVLVHVFRPLLSNPYRFPHRLHRHCHLLLALSRLQILRHDVIQLRRAGQPTIHRIGDQVRKHTQKHQVRGV